MANRALALYRRVLRVARQWEGGAVEQQWIRAEARARMEEGRALGAAAAAEVVEAAHAQVDVALHYGIAYPRLQHVDPGTVGGDGDFRRRSTRANTRLGRLRRSGMQKQFRPAGSSK